MRHFFVLLTLITSQVLSGQSLKKYSIGNTGCSVYFTCDPGKFQQSYSYLKSTLEIQKSAGYGKGATLAGSPQARGVVDYWEDKEGAQWKIKGWTDGAIIAVLYVYADGSFNETEKINIFLNGFRFVTK